MHTSIHTYIHTYIRACSALAPASALHQYIHTYTHTCTQLSSSCVTVASTRTQPAKRRISGTKALETLKLVALKHKKTWVSVASTSMPLTMRSADTVCKHMHAACVAARACSRCVGFSVREDAQISATEVWKLVQLKYYSLCERTPKLVHLKVLNHSK